MYFVSSDARCGVRQRDSHHPAHVLAPLSLPDQVARPERLPHSAPDPEGAEATHAGLLPDNVEFKPRDRYS